MILTRSCQLESFDLAGHQFAYDCEKSRSFDLELKRPMRQDVKYRGMTITQESLSRINRSILERLKRGIADGQSAPRDANFRTFGALRVATGTHE